MKPHARSKGAMASAAKGPEFVDSLAHRYLDTKNLVVNAGYAWEIDWQEQLYLADLCEERLLAEMAWVILSTGMRTAVVKKVFPSVTRCFFYWSSAEAIRARADDCERGALEVFGNSRKVRAIICCATRIANVGFDEIRVGLARDPIEFIRTFPFMGPVTAFHLAKNIGLDVVKPDRHLVRIAESNGYEHPAPMCSDIAEVVGDRIGVIDVVLWRAAAIGLDSMLPHPH
jgi:hypothetical protein